MHVVADRDNFVDLVLCEGQVLSGEVMDFNGTPVPDLPIHLFLDQGNWLDDGFYFGRSHDREDLLASTQTDENGAFQILNVPESALILALGPRWFTNSLDFSYSRMVVRGVLAGQEPLSLILPPPNTLTGRLLHLPEDEEIQVHAGWTEKGHDYNGISATFTDPMGDGSFCFRLPVADVPFNLTFQAPERAELIIEGLLLAAGETLDLGELVLEEGMKISGKVVDSRGEPMSAYLCGDFKETWSDEQGLFTLENVLPGRACIHAEAEFYLCSNLILEDSAAVQDLRIVLYRPGLVNGRFLDGRGEPRKGMMVHLERLIQEENEDRYPYFSAVNDQGSFSLKCKPGPYLLYYREGPKGEVMEGPEITIEEGEIMTLEPIIW